MTSRKPSVHKVLVCFCLASSLAIFGCRTRSSGTKDGLTPLRLQLDWYPQPEHGGFYAAQLLGYYKDEGLDVTLIPLPQYGGVAQQVASGKADIGLGASDQILEWNSSGLPLVAIAATMQHDPQAVMVHATSPIHSFPDLEGHSIAAQTGATWLKYIVSRFQLKHLRETPSTLSIASFLGDPNYVQQVFVTSEPFLARQGGAAVRTLLISDSGYDPYRVQFATRDFVREHPDVIARFVRASIRGWQAYLQNPGPTNAYLLKLNPALNPSQENYSAQTLKAGLFVSGGSDSEIGKMNAERWKTTCEQLKALGIIRPDLDPTPAFALQFVSENQMAATH